MRPIRVAHITTVPMSLRYLLLNQLSSLQQAGYQVWGISAAGPEVTEIEAAGIRHLVVPMSRNFTPLADLVTLWRLYRVIRRERFTIVHTHTPKPGLLGQLAARLAGVPIVINTLHGFYFHDHMSPLWRRFYIFIEKMAARCSDVILSQNSEDITAAVKEHICGPDKITYLGNGIDVLRFDRTHFNDGMLVQKRHELGLSPNALVVGFVGRLVVEKGLLDLLQAAQIIRKRVPEVIFLFIGPTDHEKRDTFKPEVTHEYGLADACIFAGMRQDMPELYALMNVFVLPSHREGFPRSPMEASAMGVPCVVTDIRGCREVVVSGQNGLLVPVSNAPLLADAVIDLLCNPDKARRLGEEGRRIALQRFDEQLIFEKVKTEYQRLLTDKGIIQS